MGDMWTGERIRLRGVEPEDWEGFRDLARDTHDARNADLVEPPRRVSAPGPPSGPGALRVATPSGW